MSPIKRVVISSAGHHHPENVIDNEFFESLDIGTTSSWIEDRAGIRERRSLLTKSEIQDLRHGRTTLQEIRAGRGGMSPSDIVRDAWLMAKKRWRAEGKSASEDPIHLDYFLCGTSILDYEIPSTAACIAASLGISAPSFDVNSACSSFVVGLHMARSMLASGVAKERVGLVNPERYTLRVNYADKTSAVLWGDGATAVLVEAVGESVEPPSGFEVLDTVVWSDPAGWDQVVIPYGGTFSQNGSAVQMFAVTKTVAATLEVLSKNGLSVDDMSYFIGHQANFRILQSIEKKLGLRSGQLLHNVEMRGNQGAAGAPAVLSENWEKFKKGDIVVMTVVGSGLTWASALLRRL